jgi:hypothetical protein
LVKHPLIMCISRYIAEVINYLMHIHKKSVITSGLKTQINFSLTKKKDILAFQIKKNFNPHYQENYSNAKSHNCVFHSILVH